MASPGLGRTGSDRLPFLQLSQNEGSPCDPASPAGLNIAGRPWASPSQTSKLELAVAKCDSPVLSRSKTPAGKTSRISPGHPASGRQGDMRGSAWLNQGFANACTRNMGLLHSTNDMGPGNTRDSMADISWQDRFKKRAHGPRASVLMASTTAEDLDGSSDDGCDEDNLGWTAEELRKFELLEIDNASPKPVTPREAHTPGSNRRIPSPEGSRPSMLPRLTPVSSLSNHRRSMSSQRTASQDFTSATSTMFEFDTIAKEANNVCKEIFEEEIAEIRGAPVRDSIQLNLQGEFGSLLAAIHTPEQNAKETSEQLIELETSLTAPSPPLQFPESPPAAGTAEAVLLRVSPLRIQKPEEHEVRLQQPVSEEAPEKLDDPAVGNPPCSPQPTALPCSPQPMASDAPVEHDVCEGDSLSGQDPALQVSEQHLEESGAAAYGFAQEPSTHTLELNVQKEGEVFCSDLLEATPEADEVEEEQERAVEVLGDTPAGLEEPVEEAPFSAPFQQSEATAHADAAEDVPVVAAPPSANSSTCFVQEGSEDQLHVAELQSPMQPETESPDAEGTLDEAVEPCEAAVECQGEEPLSHALDASASNDSLDPEEDILSLVGDEPSFPIAAPAEEEEQEPQDAEAAAQSDTLPSSEPKDAVHPEDERIAGPEELSQDALLKNDELPTQEQSSEEEPLSLAGTEPSLPNEAPAAEKEAQDAVAALQSDTLPNSEAKALVHPEDDLEKQPRDDLLVLTDDKLPVQRQFPEEGILSLVGDEHSLPNEAPAEEEEAQDAVDALQSDTLPPAEAKALVQPEDEPIDGPEEQPQDALLALKDATLPPKEQSPEEAPLYLVGDEPPLPIGAPTEEEPQDAVDAPQSDKLPSSEAKALVHPEDDLEEQTQDALLVLKDDTPPAQEQLPEAEAPMHPEDEPIAGPEGQPKDSLLVLKDYTPPAQEQFAEAKASVHPEDGLMHLSEQSEELKLHGAEGSAPSSPLKGADPVDGDKEDVATPGAATFVREASLKSPEPGCSSVAAGDWMGAACTNAVYGDDIRASVQVTTIDSALRARSATPEVPVRASGLQTLVALAEECGEEDFGLGEEAPVVADQPPAPAAAEPGCGNGTEGTPVASMKAPGAAAAGLSVEVEEPNDMAEMMELLMLGATPSPGNNKAASESIGKSPSPNGEIVDSFLKSLGLDGGSSPEETPPSGGNNLSGAALSPPPTAVASVPATAAEEQSKEEPGSVPATVAQSEKPVSDSSATFQSPLTRADLSREFTGVTVLEEEPSATLEASPQLPGGAETTDAAAKAPVEKETTEMEPSPPKEESADAAAVRQSVLPPSWALLASSYEDNMDSSMVLTGISMALPSSSSPHGDALDFEQQASPEVVPVGGNLDSIFEESAAVAASMGLPLDESAEHEGEEAEEEAGAPLGLDLDNIFEESAALGESLEKAAGNPVAEDDTKVRLFGMKPSGGGAGASASAEFSLGCTAPSGRSSFRKTSRLQAPRSSFHFFDTTKGTAPTEKAKAAVPRHESKSIDDLFNVVTPVRFRAGASQRAAEPHLHASYEPQISGKKAIRDRALYPGGMSCPGPFFSLITDDDMGPSSPSSWLFPVHPLAKSEAQEAPAKEDHGDAKEAAFKLSQSRSSSTFSSAFSHDTPLSQHRASGTDRVVRRVQRSTEKAAPSPGREQHHGAAPPEPPLAPAAAEEVEWSSTPHHVRPPRVGPTLSVRTSRASSVNTSASSFRAMSSSAAAAGGVLFVNTSDAQQPSKPKGGSSGGGFNKLLNKGVSRLRKPSLLAKPTTVRIAETSTHPEDNVVPPVKRTFNWGRPSSSSAAAAAPSHVSSAPGKRLRKCQEDQEAAAALEAPATPRSVKKFAGSAFKKMTTPLSGFKKTASRLLSNSKQPPAIARGDDLSATLDVYTDSSPTTGRA